MDDGSIKLIYGPMFSKKTTELINGIRRDKEKYGYHNVLAVKHSIDTRYDAEKIVSHDDSSEKAIAVPNLLIVRGIINYYSNIRVIYIDEGQFFTDLYEFCINMRDSGKHVIVAGLDKNYLREDFAPIAQIKEIANILVHQYSVCTDCNKKAQYTFRTQDLKNEIVVGGSDIYIPVSSKCFKNRTK